MKKFALWFLAFLITASTAVYQRLTGPTYPVRGEEIINSTAISYRFARSHETGKNYIINIKVPDSGINGVLVFKRFKTDDPWTELKMERQGQILSVSLPHQPPAGKLAYKVILSSGRKEISLPGENPVIIRFKGAVPPSILVLHVISMFLAMLFSVRTGIEALRPKSNPRQLALWTTGLLFVGGLILGPIVQKFAFGTLWSGFPLGFDLTDNKTLIAFTGWVVALIAGRKGRPARGWVLAASILLLVIFLIPHSLLGSELDYSKVS
jgi:hypothetical protein